ncbi:glycosyl transferase [Bacillus pseudomycoides]|nr:glycosyl transferase [Bacillus pseudomycoides]
MLSYVGRIAPEKDTETLRTLIHTTIKERKDNIHWLIAGNGSLAEELREALPANVTFIGYLQEENLAEAYACSDLMVFPSATETFGNVVLESLACGTPVVGANSGGVKNIITDGKTGFLCEPKNSNSFLSSIYQLLNNEEMRKQMGIAARFYATTQSWDEIFHGLYMQYEEVLHQNNTELLA